MPENRPVVLAIDDDQDILDMMRVVLEANDYEMVEAPSAERGLQVYKETSPNLIIVDLMMEEVDAGLGFAKNIKLLGNTAPVYMLTSVGDNMNNIVDHSELGLTGILQKPLDPGKLLKILASQLA